MPSGVDAERAFDGCPIVALGASAGGLEAFEAFFKAMPPSSGMAFVLVSHLDPRHESLLPELIQRKTSMPVVPISNGLEARADHVYVLPPDQNLTLEARRFRLTTFEGPRSAIRVIDGFFRSLAEEMGARAIGVLLSGTGTDGSVGLGAIKGAGGLVLVQSEASAKFPGMPRTAINAGLPDLVLEPGAMPAEILGFGGDSWEAPDEAVSSASDGHAKVLRQLRVTTKQDFTHYKQGTVLRRIRRRMFVHKIEDIGEYARFLRRSEREVWVLFRELLIGVTGFFRDPDAFDSLHESALPGMFLDRDPESPVRVWVPGCSTGEEAYSLAILLHEYQETTDHQGPLQIFGTDLDARAIEVARRGVYPVGISPDVGGDRLRRFFKKREGGGFEIQRFIRDDLVFATQNLIQDPPFTKLDLISCRNLLIYFDPTLQRRILPMFHYGLNPGGVLFLGSSETIGPGEDLFEVVDKKWKVFRRNPKATRVRQSIGFPSRIHVVETPALTPSGQPLSEEEKVEPMKVLEAILKQSDLPPCVVVDEGDRIVYIHGDVERFLRPAEGVPTLNLLDMARHGLKKALTDALREASKEKADVVVEGLQVRWEKKMVPLNLTVRSILERGPVHGHMIVAFQEVSESPAEAGQGKADTPRDPGAVEELEHELRVTKETLQTTIEEMEASNEELRSANEELQSTNEELQSTNEELETSKEELQSLHEEAETVNAELQSRIEDLAAANDDLKNLLDSTEIATIFLDVDLRIRRYTPFATQIIPLAPTDVGRPLKDLSPHLPGVDLTGKAREVLDTLNGGEFDVSDEAGRAYLMRVTPYRTLANVIAGVVLTFQEKGNE